MACNCLCSNEYRDCNGNWVYKASVSVSGTSMNVEINAKMCNLCRNELFRVNIPIVSPTASDLVFLVTCCGSSAPLYSGVTGAQLTATSLTAGVTYVITYDKFTRKFFRYRRVIIKGATWPPLLVFSILNEILNIKIFCGFDIQI